MSTKKILAVLLALFVLATAVSGCGNSGSSSADSQSGSSATSENSASTEDTASTDGEVPTISLMVVCGTTPPDADAVAEKLSEITREKIGCNVEFITMEIGNVAQQLNLLLSGGDDTLDVFMAGISVPYSTIVNNGQALSLDTLMEPYAEEVKTALGEKVYESGRVNGELYGIGRLLDQASTTCYNLRRDIAEEFGYKNGDKVDLAELTELFGKVREKYPDTPLIGPMNGVPSIGDSVVYFKQWKEMGCYMADILNVTDAPIDYIPSGKAFGCFASHFSAEMNGIWSSQNFGTDIASLQIYEDAVAITPGAYECITPATKNPEAAAALIYLMATDPDVENLLINGIEGQHYQVLEDNTATYVDGKDISTTGWCLGYSWTALNSTISIPFEYPADYYDRMLAANKNAQQSKAFGCQFDLTGVSDAVSACTNVVNQYENALSGGAVEDFDATLAQFQQGLRDAGIDEIVAAKQEQLDAFLAG